MTTSATTTRKAKGQRRGRPLGGGRRAKKQSDDPVLRAVEQMVEAPDLPWPRDDDGKLIHDIASLVHSGIRVLPHHLAVAAINAGFSAPEVLGLVWQWKDGKINEADFRENLGKLLSSFLRRVVRKEREDLQLRGLDGEQLSVATDDELLQFRVGREAEADRKRVCPALPDAELRSVLAALCNRDWTRTDQGVRVESLRRWLAMSPEAIRQAAGSGRWKKTDIALESPESRRLGGPMVALIEVMRIVQDGGRQLPRELAEAGAAAGFDAAALLRLSWRRKDKEITAGSFKKSLGLLLDMDKNTKDRAIRFCCWAIRTHLKLSSPRRGHRGGKPSYLMGPRAVARILRAYAAIGGELGPEARKTAATLDRIGQARPSRKRWMLPKNPPVKGSVTKCPK